MSIIATPQVLQAAFEYAGYGWKVVYLHGVNDDKSCTCAQRTDCKAAGKHPRLKAWQDSATDDEETINEWFDGYGNANVGIKLGEASGIIDIECDTDEAEQIFTAMFGGAAIITPTFSSGRGKHRLFRYRKGLPGADVAVFKPGECGLELRTGYGAKGAQSVFPPSRHMSGGRYRWLEGLTPNDVEPADLPEEVIDALWKLGRIERPNGGGTKRARAPRKYEQALNGVPEGSRHSAAVSLIGKEIQGCRVHDHEDLELCRDRCHAWNSRNLPPLPAKEIDRIFDDVLKMELDQRAKRPTGFALTDLGNAERFAVQHGDFVKYVGRWKKYVTFDGTRWKPDDDGEVYRRAADTVRSIYSEAEACEDDSKRAAIAKHAVKSEGKERINGMVYLAQSKLPINHELFDTHPMLLNVLNGTIDLRTGELLPHNREDFITQLAPVAYDPEAVALLWERTLSTCLGGDASLIEYVWKFLGYSLTGNTSEHILPIFHGAGANGKSTIINAIMSTLGNDYAMKAPPDMLMARAGETHSTERADLFRKRFVAAVETDDGRRLAEGLIKELTGGDRVRARRMREDFWEFDPTHKIALCSNHKPIIRGTDHGIWRRIRLIPFTKIIAPEDQDKHLTDKLKVEAPGILAWMVRGCLAWQRKGLGTPDCVMRATSEYRKAEDVIGEFINEQCTVDPSQKVRASDFIGRFKRWAEANGFTVPSGKRIGEYLVNERGFEKKLSTGKWYEGIGFGKRPEGDEENADA